MTYRSLLTVGALLALGTCTCEEPPGSAAHALDVVLGPGQVRCGPIKRASELIGGPAAFGQVGRGFRCNNAKVRFIVQDASRPVGITSEGGNLVDIDRVRGAPGTQETGDGRDNFREHVSAIGVLETRVSTIEVVADGTDGVGIIRVTGTPTALTLAPQAAFLSQELGDATIITDYVLRADADVIEINTTLKNNGPPLTGVQGVDFIAFGGGLLGHAPESGFGSMPLFSTVSFLAGARNDDVSYALVSADADLTIPFIDQGTTAPFYGDPIPVSAEHTFTRWIVVGDGSLESVSRRAMELRAAPRGTLRGLVMDAGAPRAGALVSALSGPLEAANARVLNEARTAADGSFSLTLPPGDVVLVAHEAGRARSAPVAARVEDGQAVNGLTLEIGRTARLAVETRFVDKEGEALGPLPSKLTLVARGATQQPLRALADGTAGDVTAYAVARDGAFAIDLAPGAYTAYVTRGFEFTRFEAAIELVAGSTTTVEAELRHALDTRGLIGAEFHQHSLGSIDAEVPVARKVMENAAEGIELAASTDHDVVTDFRPHVRAQGLEPWLQVVAGNEVSYQGVGHFNAYPWDIDDADPLRDYGTRLWWQKTVPELFRDIRTAAGDTIVQVNHPRGNVAGFLTTMLFNPVDGTRIPRPPPDLATLPSDVYDAWDGTFDAIEVNDNLGDIQLFTPEGRAALDDMARREASDVPALADWFALLGAGGRVAAMGNSDTHGINEGVGYPRNFLDVGKDDPAAVTPDDLRAAIRAQRTAVGQGCLLELLIEDDARGPGGEAQVRRAGMDSMVAAGTPVVVRLQAPPHVTPGNLEVYVNGLARPRALSPAAIALGGGALEAALEAALDDAIPATLALDDVRRLDHPLTGLPQDEGDLVVVVLSRGGTGLVPTGGRQAFCYSAPLYVDVDGDGAFTGWLAATQEVFPVP